MKGSEEIISKDDIQNFTYYTRKGYKKPIIYCYFTIDGKRKRFSTGTTDLKQASIIANEKYRMAVDGKSVKILTFRQVSKEFIKNTKHRVKEKTLYDYEIVLKYINECIGNIDISKIDNKTMGEIENFRRNYYKLQPKKKQQQYKRDGKSIKNGRKWNDQISNRRINLTMRLTISVMRYASEQGYITEQSIPKWKKLQEKRRQSWLTEKDFLKLYRYYEKKNMFYACIIGFCYYSGARIMSEVNRIKWSDVHFDKKFVVIRDRKHKNKIINTPVPLFPRTIHILEKMKEANEPTKPDDFVFTKNNRQRKSISKSFATAIKDCKLDKNLTPYSLRHGFATLMIEKYDVPLAFISKIMGHSDTQMLEKVYQHLRDDVVVDRLLREHERNTNSGKIKTLTKEWTIYVDLDEDI